MGWSAWIAGLLPSWMARLASRLVAPLVIGSAIILALLGIRRSGRLAGEKQERLKNRAVTAEAAAEEGRENAKRMEDMAKARADGPHSRADIAGRLRDGDG